MNAFSENAILSYMRTYATSDAEFALFDLPAADIIAGDPKTEVVIHHRSPDGSVLVGVSRLDKGVVYTKTILEPYEEIFIMLGDSSVEM